MNKEEYVKEMLSQLQLSEEGGFKYDEWLIRQEYQKDSLEKPGLVIKILSVIGSFLALLPFMGFLFLSGLYNSGTSLAVIGTAFIVGAVWVNKKYTKLVIDTLAISVFITGFCLLGLGLNQLDVEENVIWTLFIALALGTLGITPGYILSFISVLIITGSLLTILLDNNKYNLIPVYTAVLAVVVTVVFLKEATIITAGKKLSNLYTPLRTGLIFSFLAGMALLGKKGWIPISSDFIWISPVITIAGVLYLISMVLKIVGITSMGHKALVYFISFVLLLLTSWSPAVSGALLIILLSFLINYKTGFVLGVLAFIYFLAQFYYDLTFTLLVKSGILFLSGLLFLALYFFTTKSLEADEKI